ncbi:T9SS type A sorting domain-containing protein [Weeksellaceae bacterium A-14]
MRKKLLLFLNILFYTSFFSQAGNLDNSFAPETNDYTYIRCFTIQSDNKIVIGSDAYIGQSIPIKAIARLNSNGSLDTNFNAPNIFNNFSIFSIAEQSDGKIIVGGWDNNSGTKHYISRLNADGSIDSSFNIGTGANDIVRSVVIQTDGKIIVAGDFTFFNGQFAKYIIRLNSDGSIDNSFIPLSGPNNKIASSTILQNGKIIIQGIFSSYDNITRNNIARLNTDGTIDTTFNPAITSNDFVHSNVVEANNGDLLFGAYFSFNGTSKQRIVRIKIDGALETNFNLDNETDSPIYSISLQNDQKILIGGDFNHCNGLSRKSLARLNSDGSLDNYFNVGTGANSTVSSIITTNDDFAFISGGFSNYNEINIFRIAKIFTNENLNVVNFENSKCEIYPNPVRDRMFITEDNFSSYEIYNLVGQKVFSGKIKDKSIDTYNLMKGIYILNLKSKIGKTISKKFIKQ